jgi:AcrR family transcriptional regulator
MREAKTDRRVKYTKAMLKQALVELMKTQHISKISVKSLCEHADINRSTYYAHYADQYDLLRQVEQEVLDNLKQYLQKQDIDSNYPVSVQVLKRILDYIQENAELFRALLSENCDWSFQKDVLELSRVVSIQVGRKPDERTIEYLRVFGITGCISMVQKWLREGMIEPTAVMSEIALGALYHGITSFQA